jgi:hypothetical protein
MSIWKRLFGGGSKPTEAETIDMSGGAVSFKRGSLKCPKCGKVIPGEIPESGLCICAGCRAVLQIDNYKISS